MTRAVVPPSLRMASCHAPPASLPSRLPRKPVWSWAPNSALTLAPERLESVEDDPSGARSVTVRSLTSGCSIARSSHTSVTRRPATLPLMLS